MDSSLFRTVALTGMVTAFVHTFVVQAAEHFRIPAVSLPLASGRVDSQATALMPHPILSLAVQTVAFSPDGRRLATGNGDGQLRLWNVATGELEAETVAHNGWLFSVIWSPDGRSLFTGGKDRLVHQLDANNPSRKLRTFTGHSNDVHAVAVTRDGSTLVSSGDDRTIRVWDVATGQTRHVLAGHERQVPSVAISPEDRTIASASRDQTVRLWDLKTGVPHAVLRGHTADAMWVSFLPDGKRVASASYDQTIRLWDVAAPAPATVLTGHTYRVYNVVVNTDGQQLASAGDLTARLWDLRTGVNTKVFHLQAPPPPPATGGPVAQPDASTVAFSPGGQVLAIGSTLGQVYLVSPDTGVLLRTLTASSAPATGPPSLR